MGRNDSKMAEETWKDSLHSTASSPANDSGERRKTSLNKNTNISIKGQNKQTVSVTHQVKSLKYFKRKQVEEYWFVGEN